MSSRPLPDSAVPPSGLSGHVADLFARTMSKVMGIVGEGESPPLPHPALFRPHGNSPRYGCTHYGIMIPDLPAPHYFMACASVLGMPGLKIADVDHAVSADGPRHTAVLVHGTAVANERAFTSYSMKQDMGFAEDGSQVRFGNDLEFTGIYPDFRLKSQREGFSADLELSATGEYTWFACGPLYQHISFLTRYQGSIESEGKKLAVSGLCTWEHLRAVSLHLHHNCLLPRRYKLPADFFTYQVINLEPDTQLLLTFVTGMGRPLITAIYERVAGKSSRRLEGEVRFQVLAAQDEPAVAPDGNTMVLPKIFRWTLIGSSGITELEINADVDTPMLYGLAAGYVGGYRWEGTRSNRSSSGRGYIEYINQSD